MVVLSDLPLPPDDVSLDESHRVFSSSFKNHVFLNRIAIAAPQPGRLIPPYLRLAIACIGTVFSKLELPPARAECQAPTCPDQLASDLCLSGIRVWGVILEIDNREARLIDSILAVTLMFPNISWLVCTDDTCSCPGIPLCYPCNAHCAYRFLGLVLGDNSWYNDHGEADTHAVCRFVCTYS